MTSFEEFRAASHELLKELDAATIKMMMLVSAKEVSGPFGRMLPSDIMTL
ncbi:hypothetical protein THH46_21435 [Pseudomonas sp. NA13]